MTPPADSASIARSSHATKTAPNGRRGGRSGDGRLAGRDGGRLLNRQVKSWSGREAAGAVQQPGPVGLLTLTVSAAIGALTLAYFFLPPLYYAAFLAWGVVPGRTPFGDTVALLGALQCSREGIDVLVENACMNGVHTYSPLWLALSFLPIDRGSSGVVGLLFAAAFALSLLTLPLPRSRKARVLLAIAALSAMTAYALERGNVDLVLFVIIALAGRLLVRRWLSRILGYVLLVLAALLKFYPVVLLAVAIRERPRLFGAVLIAASLPSAGFVYWYFPQIQEAIAHIPRGLIFTDFFWAQNLPRGFAEIIAPLGGQYPVFLPLALAARHAARVADRRMWPAQHFLRPASGLAGCL